MIRIGIIGSDGGTESGHSIEVCRLLKNRPDVEIAGIFGENADNTQAIADEVNIEYIAQHPCELIERADAVMVLQRDGAYHKNCAVPFIKAGKSVFVDKPFTCDISEAEELASEAEKSGSILMGGSSMKYDASVQILKSRVKLMGKILSGYLSFPADLNGEYNGLHFYAHHLIEEMIEIFGSNPISVDVKVTGDVFTAIADYGSFPVIMNFASDYSGLYAAVYGSGRSFSGVPSANGLCETQVDDFIGAVEDNSGVNDGNKLAAAVRICCAIERSVKEKKAVILSDLY